MKALHVVTETILSRRHATLD